MADTVKAERYLEHIGYYRLSAYMYPLLQMPKEEHRYKPNSSFDQVMMLYRFDKKLRLLLFNEIEKIEVAVRSAIVNIGSEMTGNPFWLTDSSNFIDADKFRHTVDLIDAELRRSREDFIVHGFPSWVGEWTLVAIARVYTTYYLAIQELIVYLQRNNNYNWCPSKVIAKVNEWMDLHVILISFTDYLCKIFEDFCLG